MKISNIKQLNYIIKLLVEHKLDYIEVDNIKISKTKHDYIQMSEIKPTTNDQNEDDLFWSAKE